MLENTLLAYLYSPIQDTLITGLFLSTISLAIHLAVKRRTSLKFTVDDVCLLISWGLSLGTQAVILYALNHAGLGVHIADLALSTLNQYQKLYLSAICLFMSSFCLAKVAQLLFLYRLTANQSRFRASIYFVACVIIIGPITTSSCLVFACRPISKSWNAAENGQCLNCGAVYVAIAVLNIISDLTLTMLPVSLVISSQLASAYKVRIIAMMLVFFITVITGAIRLTVTVTLLHSSDETYDSAPVALLVGFEANLFILTASLPGVRQCFRIISSHSYNHRTETDSLTAFD
ncbi:conserved hypothetical protein [Talaromyces marneffei ATCC 18224]|uniref:Rhodopsin domain-containing protein n=1 Tax=Talaromyces marneffei (strain ATCC 18224 / CBS 334.59 / QM 7333) TaxID=441960 RepID=B6QSM6_TALMQ|nr:conserved hypothetical protein [Talaromyces marneffei ATCC 18224]